MDKWPELQKFALMDCSCTEDYDCDRCAYLMDVGDDFIYLNGPEGVALLLAKLKFNG